MRILHVIVSLNPAGGGPPMIAARLAAAQAGLGHEVHLVCHAAPGQEDAIDAALGDMPHGAAIHRHVLPPPTRLERWTGSGARRALQSLLGRVDVVHLHSVWEAILRVAAEEARRRDIPYFILLNGMLDPWSLAQRRLKKRLALAMGYRAMLDGAAALHLGNEDERRLIEPLGIRAPGVIIPNGIFLEEISDPPAPGTFYAAHPELDGCPYVLFLSRLHYKKGLDHLATAFGILARADPEVRLVVAGPDGGARTSFEAMIAASGLTERVHIVGPQYGRDKLAALVDAQCFTLPSRQEGFSVAITEAVGMGVPVVITTGCHFPEVAEAEAGEVVEVDGVAVGEALVRVMSDPDRRARMRENGRRLVASRYTWPKIAETAIDMYREALGRKEVGPDDDA